MALELKGVSAVVIGAAIDVHRELGPGFLESVYEAAFAVELRARQIPFERQCPIRISYQGIDVGEHRIDLLVASQVVIELKAIRELADVHFAVVRSYLRAAGLRHGLILNFARPTLEVRRVVADRDYRR